MKWSNTQGKTTMDGGFKKHGHGCPLLLTRPPSNPNIHFISEICFFCPGANPNYARREGLP